MSHTLIRTVGGIQLHVFTAEDLEKLPSRVLVVFLLHGRQWSVENVRPIATKLVEQCGSRLIVVCFDLPNHGSRTVDPLRNEAWSKNPQANNDQHALDMFAIQTQAAKEVSFLIDFLPSSLFPDGKTEIVDWGLAGISLGGHATWLGLAIDPRITIGIPVVGCPDYLGLMTDRAINLGLDLNKCIPRSLEVAIQAFDPAHVVKSNPNLYLGKRILVLSGKDDKLVPWSMSERFVEELSVGPSGVKEVRVYPGVGHDCTHEMIHDAAEFILKYCP